MTLCILGSLPVSCAAVRVQAPVPSGDTGGEAPGLVSAVPVPDPSTWDCAWPAPSPGAGPARDLLPARFLALPLVSPQRWPWALAATGGLSPAHSRAPRTGLLSGEVSACWPGRAPPCVVPVPQPGPLWPSVFSRFVLQPWFTSFFASHSLLQGHGSGFSGRTLPAD